MPKQSEYTEEVALQICSRMAEGESVRSICRDEEMPCLATIFNWLRQQPTFVEHYTRAREVREETIFEENLEISDDGTNDWMERRSEAEKGAGVNTGWTVNGEHIQRSRLRVDTRKWMLARMNPKKYGEKQTLEHTDPNGNNPFAPLMELIGGNGRPKPGKTD